MLTCKISKGIGIIRKMSNIFPRDILLCLYYSLVHPYFVYCNIIWSCYSNNSKSDKISILQRKAIRAVFKIKMCDSVSTVMSSLNLLTVMQINILQIGCLMYQIVNGLLPDSLFGIFYKNSDTHSYHTRSKNKLCIPKHRTKMREQSIHVVGARIWNLIPDNIKTAITLPAFKNLLKTFILKEKDYFNLKSV